MRPQVHVQDLGQAAYKPTWDLQERLLKEAVDRKIARRRAGLSESNRNPLDNPSDHPWPEHHLLFVEHPHVLTLGKSGDANHVVASPERLEALGVEYHEINRGGDITYHGPGQLVAYPILDLDQFRTDIGWYLRQLEEAVIRTCADWGVPSGRVDGLTGVWIDPEAGQAARKICAIGVKCSRWVTMHGLAFNLNTDLDFFNLIVPCGIQDRGVTTLAAEANRKVARSEARDALESHLLDVIGADSFAPRP
ncbi:MAG: lipoyl(octanoyl) transferase LipB [Flavobacteriales bacterium]|nr:lipoyl(octanoyl) transferase LipB [Flavobacteriales bacterium]